MSPTVKSGLIFGGVGFLLVLLVGFVPSIGPLLCGPFVALVVGGVAGYFALRWNPNPAGIGQGVLAGTLAGLGALVGGLISWITLFALIQSIPEAQEMIDVAIQQQIGQDPNLQLTADDVRAMFGIVGPVAGWYHQSGAFAGGRRDWRAVWP